RAARPKQRDRPNERLALVIHIERREEERRAYGIACRVNHRAIRSKSELADTVCKNRGIVVVGSRGKREQITADPRLSHGDRAVQLASDDLYLVASRQQPFVHQPNHELIAVDGHALGLSLRKSPLVRLSKETDYL